MGFTNNKGDFLDREEAMTVGKKLGQLPKETNRDWLEALNFARDRAFMPKAEKSWDNERPLTRRNIAMLMGWPREEGEKKFEDLSPEQQKGITKYYAPKNNEDFMS